MKKQYCFLFFICILFPLLAGCKKIVTPPSAKTHEEWKESLNDSIAYFQQKYDSVQTAISELKPEINQNLENFRYINNPREVEGYYILNSWVAKYPLKSTGIIARITEREGIEISAALSKGRFTHISLSSGNEEYTAPPVPHDQALNYLTPGIDRVCFSDNVADSIAAFISMHKDESITMMFIENTTTGKTQISQEEKEMISQTYAVCEARQKLKNLEKLLPLYSGRINACRKLMEKKDSTYNTNQ